MKVLYLIDSLKGFGAEKSLVEITTRFKRIRPIFVQIYKGEQLKKNLEERGIKVYSLNLGGKYNFTSAEKLIFPIIKSENPEVIHSTLFRADIVGRRIKKKLPYILLVGSLVNNSYSSYRMKEMSFVRKTKHLFIKEWDRITSKYVDYFISNSAAIVEPSVQALKIKRERIETIYRGRDLSSFCDVTGLTGHLPLNKKNSPIFINVARLEIRKGQRDLIKAFDLFLRLHPESILLLVGEGSQKKKLKELVLSLNLEKSVKFLGYRNDIPNLLAASDFFVFPSYYEGLPGALIEAIFSKTPVIVSNIPENKECLAPDSALFFSPGNLKEIHETLEKAATFSDWNWRTEKAFRYAKERFEISQISQQYEDFYFRIYKEFKAL